MVDMEMLEHSCLDLSRVNHLLSVLSRKKQLLEQVPHLLLSTRSIRLLTMIAAMVITKTNSVRTIPRKAPNIQYPIILASSDTNTQYQYQVYSVGITTKNPKTL